MSRSSSRTWCLIPAVSIATDAWKPGSSTSIARFGEAVADETVLDRPLFRVVAVDPLHDEGIDVTLLDPHVQAEGVVELRQRRTTTPALGRLLARTSNMAAASRWSFFNSAIGSFTGFLHGSGCE